MQNREHAGVAACSACKWIRLSAVQVITEKTSGAATRPLVEISEDDAWRLHVLDLETNVERMIGAETRYIDDQVEWLDSQHLLYAVPRRTTAVSDVWVAPVDGAAPPRVFLPEASSPIVVR